jgi:hypothetical protein
MSAIGGNADVPRTCHHVLMTKGAHSVMDGDDLSRRRACCPARMTSASIARRYVPNVVL